MRVPVYTEHLLFLDANKASPPPPPPPSLGGNEVSITAAYLTDEVSIIAAYLIVR